MANDNHASYAKIGLAVVLGVVAIVGALVYIGKSGSSEYEFLAETYYDKPVSGLSVGSAVNFRGVKIGEVRDINFVSNLYDVDGTDARRIYILMAFPKSKILPYRYDASQIDGLLRDMVERGLRATVSASGITGLSRIELDFSGKDAESPAPISWVPRYSYIPAAASLLDNFSDSATRVMNQINKMDLNSAWSNVNSTVESMARTMDSARIIMESLQAEFEKIVDDAGESAESMKDVLDELKKNPSLLVRERIPAPLPETERK